MIRLQKVEVLWPNQTISQELNLNEVPLNLLQSAKRLALLPLGVDSQVHLRVPGQSHKESLEGGIRSAIYGGVAYVLTMPNTNPVIDSVDVLKNVQKEMAPIEKKWGVRILWSAAMTRGQEGTFTVQELPALKKAGVVALTDDGKGVASDAVMDELLALSAKHSLPLLQHAEVPGHGCALAAGPTQEKLGLSAYPAEAEWKMFERDINLLKNHPGARYHALHVSSQKSLELIEAAKRAGLPVTAEVTPHHLFFNSTQIPDKNTSFKMNPPIRSREDQLALQKALSTGLLDWVATDHAPHEAVLKGEDFRRAAFGTTALEATLGVLVKLLNEGNLSLENLGKVFAYTPAKYWGIPNDDLLRISSDAQVQRGVLVDLGAEAHEITMEDLKGQAKNSCFLGQKLPGKILSVWTSAGHLPFDS